MRSVKVGRRFHKLVVFFKIMDLSLSLCYLQPLCILLNRQAIWPVCARFHALLNLESFNRQKGPLPALLELSVVRPQGARLSLPALGQRYGRRLCELTCLTHPHRPWQARLQ